MMIRCWFCKWCGLRIVRHHIGNSVLVWVHARTGVIWCGRTVSDPLVCTARPRWIQPRKWSHA